jgi:hypothetical protein
MSKGIFIEGVKRSGKTKYAIDLIHDYLKRGRKVATNLDIYLDKMDVKNPHVIRLPDHMSSTHLKDLGCGYPELEESDKNYDETKNGLVVIDELLTFLNSRSFKDKDRLQIVSWFVQMGKYGWDLVLIGQDFEGVDKQLRDTTIDQLINVKSGANYFGFGFLNSVVQRLFNALNVPKFSVARFYDGKAKTRKAQGYQFYIKSWCHDWYNTAQKFLPDIMTTKDGRLVQMESSYCLVPTEQLKKWYLVRDKVNEVIENKKAEKDKKPVLKKWHIPALVVLGSYLAYTFYPDITKPAVTTTVTPIDSHQTDTSPFKITQYKPDILEGVYITCSVIADRRNSHYCFEKEGKPFYPDSIGITFEVVSNCTAKLKFNDSFYNIHCLPYRVDSYSYAKRPTTDEPTTQQQETSS